MTTSSSVGQKLWNYCNVLRDAGLSYGDYLEQLSYLIFLKMMHERTQPPFTLLPGYQPPNLPQGYDWSSLLATGWRCPRHPLSPDPRYPRTPDRHPRRHLPQGPEPYPRTRHAHPPHQGTD